MNCERVRPYLTAYAAGETEAATTGWVTAHLSSCDACRNESARHGSISTSLRLVAATDVEAPAHLADAVLVKVRERAEHDRRRLIPIPPVPPGELVRVIQENRDAILGAASTVAVAAGTAWIAYRLLKTRKPRPQTA